MMDMPSLYEEDLSLFGGDLLVGLPLVPVESGFKQDGLKSLVATTQPDTALLGEDVLGLEQSNNGLLDPFSHSWMDTKTDLLDYLAGEVSSIEEIPIAPGNASQDIESKSDSIMLPQDSSTSAIEVLKGIAEDTAVMLESTNISEDLSQDLVSIDLLDMLASGLTDDVSDVDMTPMIENSSMLSSMTPEDIESVLSSEPPSPSMDVSLEFLSDNSFTESSLNSSSEMEQHPSPALDLAMLLKQVQGQQQQLMVDSSLEEENDPTYEPYQHKSNARAKPYERKTKKDTAKPPKEAKLHERKMRKKQQNKDAATRYRQKKRQEQDIVFTECEQLENRNVELKDTVDQMTREISYLKNLLSEVYEAKGLMTGLKVTKIAV